MEDRIAEQRDVLTSFVAENSALQHHPESACLGKAAVRGQAGTPANNAVRGQAGTPANNAVRGQAGTPANNAVHGQAGTPANLSLIHI